MTPANSTCLHWQEERSQVAEEINRWADLRENNQEIKYKRQLHQSVIKVQQNKYKLHGEIEKSIKHYIGGKIYDWVILKVKLYFAVLLHR